MTVPPNASQLQLRIDKFEQLEKIAPNPQCVRALSSSQPGEYTVDLTNAPGVGKPIVLFKYQLHLPPGQADKLVPLSVVPQWKCSPSETKLLIAYHVNPTSSAFASSTGDSPFGEARIDDLAFTVPVKDSAPSNLQSKPFPGESDPAGQTIVYRAEGVSAGTPSGRVVARMNVESQVSPLPISVKWVLGGSLCSALGVSVREDGEGGWREEVVKRVVQSGKFLVE